MSSLPVFAIGQYGSAFSTLSVCLPITAQRRIDFLTKIRFIEVRRPTQVRLLAVTGRHSKNVAGKKNKLDSLKTKLFNRLAAKITVAAKLGGTDSTKNINLSRALREAHSMRLPKENIERALRKATEVNTETFSSGVYEVFGHSGVGLVVVSLTDSSNRAVKTI